MTDRDPNEVIARAAGWVYGGLTSTPDAAGTPVPVDSWMTPDGEIRTRGGGLIHSPPDYSHPDNRGALDEVIRGMTEDQQVDLSDLLHAELKERFKGPGWMRRKYEVRCLTLPQTTLRDAVADVLGGA